MRADDGSSVCVCPKVDPCKGLLRSWRLSEDKILEAVFSPGGKKDNIHCRLAWSLDDYLAKESALLSSEQLVNGEIYIEKDNMEIVLFFFRI